MNGIRSVALMLAVLALQFISADALFAQSTPRAGLVIVHGDGDIATRCVELGSESASGYDLLSQSGIEMLAEPSGMGMTICKLDGEGCGSQESCFCQCQGSPCIYWSYWQMVDGAWRYSNLGAANTRLADGSLDGWVWGDGTSGQAPQPPAMSFADVCSSAPTSSGTSASLAVTGATSSSAAIEPQTSVVEAATPAQSAQATPAKTSLSTLLVVLIPLPLLGGAYWFWRRKGVA